MALNDSPFKAEKTMPMLAKVNIYANRLHAIKRYMDKRNLPGTLLGILEYSSQQATIQRL